MKFTPAQRIPALVALGVIILVCWASWRRADLFERLERMTFDMRVRAAVRYHPTVATNLGFVFIDEDSVQRVWNGSLGYRFGLYWPRQVYGRIVQELATQGARAIAFDVLFGELRPDHPAVQMADGSVGPDSDDFFAQQMRRAGNVIIAQTPEITPPALFATNAWAVGDVSTDKDLDSILRRAKVFRLYHEWHPAFLQLEADPGFGVDLRKARIEPRRIVLPRAGGEPIVVPLDANGNFEVADFWGDNLPPGIARKARPFTEERVWHMGVVLAARELGLDLANAQIDLPHGRITLRNRAGLERVIPVDGQGNMLIDWCLTVNSPQLTREPIQDLLEQYRQRLLGATNQFLNRWRGKLAIIGSSAVVGNNLTDRGATPLSPDTLLVSKHWNVANSIITGRFVRRAPLGVELGLVVLLGLGATIVTLRLRVLLASMLVLLLSLAYAVFASILYFRTRYWLPIVLPLGGAWLMTHVCLVTWRVVFESAERKRVRSIFSTIVSPKIVNELLQAQALSLGGTRREITVLFADVRGFTEFTDSSQEQVAEHVRQRGLQGQAAETCFDEQARETLRTINLYLGLVAETILQQDGTLDKFIGDCVMAFWGAPTPHSKHALACVRAAVQAQRGIHDLNLQRAAQNKAIALENQARAAAGQPPVPLLPILFVGTGINTGMATVGLMGAETKSVVRQGSYTVFGREVNLASRLESASERGRIFISQSTWAHLQRDDPALGASCVPLPPLTVKGIRAPVQVYEVPWRLSGTRRIEEEFALPQQETAKKG
ncbi:MAG TPA: adenylate/guanylate cyclase domain-containing protein [Verrucomicrobiae bacterium]|nr:adenylate/guanylate cyclase domain-containing protein [Verrucomicrobiae bacterium]